MSSTIRMLVLCLATSIKGTQCFSHANSNRLWHLNKSNLRWLSIDQQAAYLSVAQILTTVSVDALASFFPSGLHTAIATGPLLPSMLWINCPVSASQILIV